MLVIGGSSPSLAIMEPGITVPYGSLNHWKAARDNSAAQRVEIVEFGDSTTYGISSGGNYARSQALRAALIAAGVTDGGVGYLATLGTRSSSSGGTLGANSTTPDGPYLTAVVGFDTLDAYGSSFYTIANSTTAGDYLEFTVPATHRANSAIRKWYFRNTQDAGQFTYSINGGTATLVQADVGASPVEPAVSGGFWSPSFTYLPGLAPGDKLRITNVGGVYERTPAFYNSGPIFDNGAGSLAAGSYFYKITKVTSGTGNVGETLPSAPVNLTVAASHSIGLRLGVNAIGPADGTWNIYRSTTLGGTYGLLTTVTGTCGIGGFLSYVDDGTLTPGAQQPPATDTSKVNTTRKTVRIGIDLMNNTGVVVHNHGISGATLTSYFDIAAQDNNLKAIGPLGLARQSGSNYVVSEQLPQSGTANDRRPVLSTLAMGANDIAQATTIASVQGWAASIELWINMCRNANCDPLLLIPTGIGVTNNGGERNNMGIFRSTVTGVAMSHGVPIIDMQQALGPLSTNATWTTNSQVHLDKSGYDKEGIAIANVLTRV